MPKYNLELFKTLILNFAHIHSERRKLGMFILFPKYQFIYPNKVNLPQIHQFPSFLIFGHVTCHVTFTSSLYLLLSSIEGIPLFRGKATLFPRPSTCD